MYQNTEHYLLRNYLFYLSIYVEPGVLDLLEKHRNNLKRLDYHTKSNYFNQLQPTSDLLIAPNSQRSQTDTVQSRD